MVRKTFTAHEAFNGICIFLDLGNGLMKMMIRLTIALIFYGKPCTAVAIFCQDYLTSKAKAIVEQQ